MNQPNYYAIIPANVRYNPDLSYLEKFLYCEFTALSNLNGYCSAKNKYFASLYEKDEKTISRSISRLEELGFIYIEYDKVGARITQRRIYPLDIKTTSDKIVNGTETTGDKNITREQEKLLFTVDKIVTDNNSSYEDIIKLIIVSFKKENKERKIEDDVIALFPELNQDVVKSIHDWLLFKKEKHQTYKETGLKTLLNKILKWQKDFGSQYIIDAIEDSISHNYSGIFPAKKQISFNQRKPYGNGDPYEYRED